MKEVEKCEKTWFLSLRLGNCQNLGTKIKQLSTLYIFTVDKNNIENCGF